MKTISKTKHLASRVIEGQAFIVNTKTSTLHELDATATFIWQLIEKKKNSEQILKELISNYEVAEETAALDLDNFIKDLEIKGLVEAC